MYKAYLIAELEKAVATVLRTERQYLHHAQQLCSEEFLGLWCKEIGCIKATETAGISMLPDSVGLSSEGPYNRAAMLSVHLEYC